MKIIKKGILPDEYVALITCSYCNCRFECTKSEGKCISNTRNESFFQLNCPTCKKYLYAELSLFKPPKEENEERCRLCGRY